MYKKKRFRRLSRRKKVLDYIKLYFIISIALIIFYILTNNLQKYSPKLNEPKIIKSITRSMAYKRGMDIINYVWEYSLYKNGINENNTVELPNYIKNEEKIKTSGIPYCWGGYISLDISNRRGVKNFKDAIDKGYTAGNVHCEGIYKENTAGLDCAGFVSAVFMLPEKCSTQSLKLYFKKIDFNDLKPMDIINSEKNHVLIYIGESEDKKGIVTMESAINKHSNNGEKTIINYRSWDFIKKRTKGNPYVAMRYKAIVDDVIKSFKDINEYNSDIIHSTKIKLCQQSEGVIDYVDDKDYFKINIIEGSNYILKLSKLPKFCTMTITNIQEKTILNAKNIGTYNLKLLSGTYYIKFEAKDFKFNIDEDYIFCLS